MTRNKLVLITLIILLLFGMSCHKTPIELQPMYKEVSVNEKAVHPQKPLQKVSETQAYIERGPITITSDTELNNSVVTGFKGNGTIDDPILIDGYNITAPSGNLISIIDTTYYFCISNCILNGLTTAGRGIDLQNVQHGTIVNNTITNCNSFVISVSVESKFNTIDNNTLCNNNNGVYLYDTSNNTITGNWVFDNNGDGFHVGGKSNNNSIFNNTIYDNQDGIVLESSYTNLISGNKIFNNDYTGISFLDYGSGGSHNNTITGNRIYGHQNSGIDIQASKLNLISNNTVYNNNGFGINLGDPNPSHNNTIRNNTVYGSGWAGIALISSDNNTIERNSVYINNNGINVGNSNHNTFIANLVYDNSPRGIVVSDSQVNNFHNNVIFNNAEWGISIESSSINNTVQFNDFSGNNAGNQQALDQATNSIFANNYWSDWTMIGSYAIAGSAGNQDLSPLMNPYHLSVPIITAPTAENLTLTGIVSIQWSASIDSFGHSLTYSVLYSTNDGGSWTTLASDLKTTNHTFDTMLIADGPILFKIQATDSIGFTSIFISEETYLIENDQLSPPTILSPNGGETLNETVTIEWTASLDSLNHSITYTIYYSADNGATWTQIATGLTSTSYVWDTTTVSNGFSYLIKVVATCSEGETEEDLSDGLFTIQNVIPPSTTTSETSSTTTPTTPSPIPGMTGIGLLVALLTLIMVKNWKKR
ncbi:MAG: right-handed parallel beta-helix repeat-containing protein [Promethearchaeota archaeon]